MAVNTLYDDDYVLFLQYLLGKWREIYRNRRCVEKKLQMTQMIYTTLTRWSIARQQLRIHHNKKKGKKMDSVWKG